MCADDDFFFFVNIMCADDFFFFNIMRADDGL